MAIWTEADDYFIHNKVSDLSDLELAKALGKTEKQVVARIKKLGIDIDSIVLEKKRLQAQKGFMVGEGKNPAVAMTGSRSLADDIFAGTSPYGGKGNKNKTRKDELQKELNEIVEAENQPEPKTNSETLVEKFKVKNNALFRK